MAIAFEITMPRPALQAAANESGPLLLRPANRLHAKLLRRTIRRRPSSSRKVSRLSSIAHSAAAKQPYSPAHADNQRGTRQQDMPCRFQSPKKLLDTMAEGIACGRYQGTP